MGLLLLMLAALRMSPLRVAVYALNPLVIVEFSGSGHLDSAGIFFMVLALYLCHQAQKPVVSRSPCSFFSCKAVSRTPAAGNAAQKKTAISAGFFLSCFGGVSAVS